MSPLNPRTGPYKCNTCYLDPYKIKPDLAVLGPTLKTLTWPFPLTLQLLGYFANRHLKGGESPPVDNSRTNASIYLFTHFPLQRSRTPTCSRGELFREQGAGSSSARLWLMRSLPRSRWTASGADSTEAEQHRESSPVPLAPQTDCCLPHQTRNASATSPSDRIGISFWSRHFILRVG